MGTIIHNTIVVTGLKSRIEPAHAKAKEIFPWVSELCPEKMNGYTSFFIPPDGSKEGWKDSDDGDEQRGKFLRWLDSQPEQYLEWVEVVFGSDLKGARVVDENS